MINTIKTVIWLSIGIPMFPVVAGYYRAKNRLTDDTEQE